MSKSRVACQMSIDLLLQGKTTAFLWTFTVPENRLDPRETARRWNRCQRKLVGRLGFVGVRVFELHPGGHGLHIHLVCRQRYPVCAVRDVTTRYGFGRINVKAIPAISGGYIAKYLTKQTLQDFPELKGLRLWAKIGTKISDWKGVKVNDVFCDSDSLKLFRAWLPFASFDQARSFHFVHQLMQGARLVSADVCYPEFLSTEENLCIHFVFCHPVSREPLPRPAFVVT